MNSLLSAIMTKCAGSALSVSVGGRIYEGVAPSGAGFPYIVFFIVAGVTDDNFTDFIDELTIQFSLYSISPGLTEITGLYEDLKSLFDYCQLNISGYSHIGMIRVGFATMTDDITTPAGTESLRHWAVDYLVRVEK